MAQSFYTSIGGIKSAQTQINVVANNLANINTVGFKESSVNFSDLFYNTISSGSSLTERSAGTNPLQIGFGVQVSSIHRNFAPGSTQSTGLPTDLCIKSSGFFTLLGPNNQVLYTRAGNFTVDANGNLVLPGGYKLLGMGSEFSMVSGTTPIHIPQFLDTKTIANTTNLTTKDIDDLNNFNYADGTFYINVSPTEGADPIKVEIDVTGARNLGEIQTRIQTALNDAADPDGDPATAQLFDPDAISVGFADGQLQFNVVTDDTASHFVGGIAFENGTSTFLTRSDILTNVPITNTDGSTTYSTKTLDYKQVVAAAASEDTAAKYSEMNINEGGQIEVKYSNGDNLTVMQDLEDGTLIFKYTTLDGVEIVGEDVLMGKGVVDPANLQIGIANFMNPNGLVTKGSNTYAKGDNAGEPIYGIPGTNSFSALQSGALESSNVDMTKQFADMIVAQRAIESNSRVFSVQNEILKSLVYMGS